MAVFALSSSAQGAVILRLTDLDTLFSLTVTDGGAGDSNSAGGTVTYVGPVGANWTINVSTGLSSSGKPGIPTLDLSSLNSSLAAGSLRIEVTDTGFAAGSPIGLIESIGGTTAGSVAAIAWLDPTNTAFGHGAGAVNAVNMGTFSGPSFSKTASGASTALTGPFSITEQVTVTHTAAGVTSFDFFGQAVPEPATLWSAALGLGVCAWIARRRTRRA